MPILNINNQHYIVNTLHDLEYPITQNLSYDTWDIIKEIFNTELIDMTEERIIPLVYVDKDYDESYPTIDEANFEQYLTDDIIKKMSNNVVKYLQDNNCLKKKVDVNQINDYVMNNIYDDVMESLEKVRVDYTKINGITKED